MKLPVDYFAQLTGFKEKAVNNALRELVNKQLISRFIDHSYYEPRITYMNWPLIAADAKDFKYVSKKGKHKPTEEPTAFPLGDWPEGKQTPSEDVDPPPVEFSKPSEKNSKPLIEAEDVDAGVDFDFDPPAPEEHEIEAVVPAGRETFAQMLFRLMPDLPMYKNPKQRENAEKALAGFNNDEEFRAALEWTLSTPEAEWYEELHSITFVPHSRIAKCREIIIDKRNAHLYQENRKKQATAKPKRKLRYGNPVTEAELDAYLLERDGPEPPAAPAAAPAPVCSTIAEQDARAEMRHRELAELYAV
jgi:hypothetical protein